MSDHDAAPDPIDKAYVQAEAVLSDAAARAARRARVLAAVARQSETPLAAAAAAAVARRPAWRRGRWLAAASVAGLGVAIASQIYQPPPPKPRPASAAPAASIPAMQGSAARPSPSIPAPSVAPPPPVKMPPVQHVMTIEPPSVPPAAPPAAPAPIASIAPAPAPPPPPAFVGGVQAAPTAAANDAGPLSGGEEGAEVDAQAKARWARIQAAPAPAAAFTASPIRSDSLAVPPSAGAAKLRAAAAAGRTAELKALLGQGVPVDAPDADGDTALMKSIRADRPAVSALLRRHGASLDLRNRAGESARDMATAKGDAALNQALGLSP